jgi:hypothetical protein
MHDYQEILPRAVGIVLHALSEERKHISEQLQTSGATHLVKASQAVQLAKVCFAAGVVATSEAQLKTEFQITDRYAFKAIAKELREHGERELAEAMERIVDATNALKHGDGTSYEALLRADPNLQFKVKARDEAFFEEGDVSEVPSLVQVEDEYIRHCEDVLLSVLHTMRKIRQTL